MTRLATLARSSLLAPRCNKPTEEHCRKALGEHAAPDRNGNLRDHAALEGEVRRCKGGSKRKAVDCAINAQTLDDLSIATSTRSRRMRLVGGDTAGQRWIGAASRWLDGRTRRASASRRSGWRSCGRPRRHGAGRSVPDGQRDRFAKRR